ncbi:hypothetical protein [Brevibacterium album]|uniref:hypothetical protein n=1 Tax=Brevibacterium album TaxID=417948 RepID=UPI00040C3AF8|nr:hypothetical protein [Brevibacterium album]
MDTMTRTFSTAAEAAQHYITEPIEASEMIANADAAFDTAAIAAEVIEAITPDRGNVFYRQREDIDHDEFWSIVERYEREG